jgi:RNA polymerase sigma-70 factor (ECF subfamily)
MKEHERRERIECDVFIEKLFFECYDYLLAIITRMIHDEKQAEDIVQETFVEALRSIGKLYRHPEPRGWLVLTAKHKCYRYLRSVKQYDTLKFRIQEDDEKERALPSDPSLLFTGLQPVDREILTMYYIQKKRMSDLSVILGIKETSVRSRLSRARKHLESNLRKSNMLLKPLLLSSPLIIQIDHLLYLAAKEVGL